jgi:hypothetical protein
MTDAKSVMPGLVDFHPYFQPIVSLRSGTLPGFALLAPAPAGLRLETHAFPRRRPDRRQRPHPLLVWLDRAARPLGTHVVGDSADHNRGQAHAGDADEQPFTRHGRLVFGRNPPLVSGTEVA